MLEWNQSVADFRENTFSAINKPCKSNDSVKVCLLSALSVYQWKVNFYKVCRRRWNPLTKDWITQMPEWHNVGRVTGKKRAELTHNYASRSSWNIIWLAVIKLSNSRPIGTLINASMKFDEQCIAVTLKPLHRAHGRQISQITVNTAYLYRWQQQY